jgi:outer membrane protein assembly factor BamB
MPQLTTAWTDAVGATSPVVANGILYAAGNGTLGAYDPTTGATLWTATVGPIHWQSPVVVDGLVLLEDNSGNLTAWGP